MSRRGAREGSIVHRKDGRWEGKVTIGVAGQRKSVYAKSRGAVVRALHDMRARENQGAVLGSRSETVEHFLSRWLTEVAAKNVRGTSYERYRDIVANHLVPALGAVKIDGLGVEQVQAMLNAEAERGHSAEKTRAVLRNALNVAIKWRLLTWNPAELADLPRWTKRKPRFLQIEEADRFLTAIVGDRLEALYVLALSMALREGELLGLRWSDVDTSARQLSVKVQLQPVRGKDGRRHPTLVAVKSEMSNRVLPIPTIACDALLAHRERQSAGRMASLHGLVFPSVTGTPMGARNLLRAFKTMLRKAGLPEEEIRFHDLRHSCASFLVARGVDPKTVQAILGHSTVRLTMDTYAHAMPEPLRAAAREIDRVLSGRRLMDAAPSR